MVYGESSDILAVFWAAGVHRIKSTYLTLLRNTMCRLNFYYNNYVIHYVLLYYRMSDQAKYVYLNIKEVNTQRVGKTSV